MAVEFDPYKPFHHYDATEAPMGVILLSGRAEDGSPSGDVAMVSTGLLSGRLPVYFGRMPKGSEIAQAVRTVRQARRTAA